jgi:hypothetical protein
VAVFLERGLALDVEGGGGEGDGRRDSGGDLGQKRKVE